MSMVAKWLDESRHLVLRYTSSRATLCDMGPPDGTGHSSSQFLVHVYCGQTVTHLSNLRFYYITKDLYHNLYSLA